MRVLMFGRGRRGGIYYYVRELERALAKKGVEITNSWRDFLHADVVHYHFDSFGNARQIAILMLLTLARATGRKAIVTTYCPTARETRELHRRIYNFLLYKIANKIIVHDPVEWGFSSKTEVLPHGNFSFYLNYLPKAGRAELKKKWNVVGKNVVLSYGVIRPSRNFPFAFEIMRDVVCSAPDTALLIAGQAGAWGLEKCGLSRVPEFARLHAHYMREKETAELFTIADAVLLTNTQNNHSAVPHIAYCFRTPVIAPRALGHQVTITAATKNEFTRKILAVLKNRPSCEAEFRREMHESGWKNIAEKTLRIYSV